MKLSLGKVIEYYDKRGFGFIKPVCFSSDNSNSSKVFFHIKDVKHLDIESKLIGIEHNTPLYIWYISKETHKGIAVKECWLNYNLIPTEYLMDFVGEAFEFLSLSPKEPLNISPALSPNIVKSIQSQDISKECPFFCQPTQDDLNDLNQKCGEQPITQEEYFNYLDQEYDKKELSSNIYKKYNCSPEETQEIEHWIEIYRENNCKEHYKANDLITEMKLWDDFKNMRSKNTYGDYKTLGIRRRFFKITCEILNFKDMNGRTPDDCEPY